MRLKSKKNASACSTSKSKKLEVITLIVALPSTNNGEGITPVAAIPTREAMVGKNGDLGQNAEMGKAGSQTMMATSPGNLKLLKTIKENVACNAAPMTTATVSTTGDVNRNAGNVKEDAGVGSVPVSSNPNVLKTAQAHLDLQNGAKASIATFSTEKIVINREDKCHSSSESQDNKEENRSIN